jgi:hypothetical protein
MVVRWVIDVLESTMELQEACDRLERVAGRPTLLDIRCNRFIPQDFVFRCKVVECP